VSEAELVSLDISESVRKKWLYIREYQQQLLLLILIIVSQHAWQHHGGEKTMVGPLLLQIQWTFTSPLFPAHGPLPSEDHAPAKSKSETRMIKQMPSMP